MPDQEDRILTEQIKRVAGTGKKDQFPVMTGKVVSVNTSELTAVIQLTCKIGVTNTETNGVSLNVILGNMLGMYGVPAAGADCLVCEVDGPGKWELLKASKYDDVVLRSDALGGIPIVQKVADNLKTLSDYIKNTLEPAIKDGLNAVGVGSSANGPAAATSFSGSVSAKTIDYEDMENKKVKHG